jgi:acyl-CoA reductase-like NAD-dependent aldehyde dehydrogenase
VEEQAMPDVHEFWIAGRRERGARSFEVRSPYDGALVAEVGVPDDDQVERAVAGAGAAAAATAGLPAHVRAQALRHVSARLEERAEEMAELITAESGKPRRWAAVEVARAASTFRWAAEEARRWSGELQRLDTDVAGERRLAVVRRFPRGPVLAIAPFNFPLNLVAHKVAPALAVGATLVIKPAPKTPLSALLLGELLAETDLPAGSWSVLPVLDEAMPALVADPRLPVVSFTGSGPVGWRIKDAVPRKHVTLELGGNGAVLVAPDWSGPEDLRWAAERIATFANYQAGQSCISVQRVFADRTVYDALVGELVQAVARLRTGDPRDPEVEVGPVINLASAERIESWIAAAVEGGATVLAGGERTGTTVSPTVVVDVPPGSLLVEDEVFGPVVTVTPVDGVEDGFARINDSRFGLQAGVLTRDLTTAFAAHRNLDVGGVVVGDVPSYRADQMPYGGVKGSGVGREGLRAAMEDFTVEKVMVLSGIDL